MKKIINKSDWSGEETEIKINKKKGTVYIKALDITITIKRYRNKNQMFKDLVHAHVYYDGQPICEGSKFDRDEEWELYDGYNCRRSSPCLYTAAAQMACNLI